MVAALDNNKNLFNTNKMLREQVKQLGSRAESAERRANGLQVKLDALVDENANLRNTFSKLPELPEREKLQEANEALVRLNTKLKRELELMLYPEMGVDERRAALKRVQEQAAELEASGLVPTQAQLDERDARLDEKYGVINLMPGETAAAFDARKAAHAGAAVPVLQARPLGLLREKP